MSEGHRRVAEQRLHFRFTEQSLSNALRLEQYIKDAEDDGDSELADLFRRAQEASRKGGEQGKELLRSRLSES